jgi:hypothetical protein
MAKNYLAKDSENKVSLTFPPDSIAFAGCFGKETISNWVKRLWPLIFFVASFAIGAGAIAYMPH